MSVVEQRLRAAEKMVGDECKNSRRLAGKLAAVAQAWADFNPDRLDVLLAPHMPGASAVEGEAEATERKNDGA